MGLYSRLKCGSDSNSGGCVCFPAPPGPMTPTHSRHNQWHCTSYHILDLSGSDTASPHGWHEGLKPHRGIKMRMPMCSMKLMMNEDS
eukprot:2571993-Amphidinium_carterae.1